MSCIIPEKYEVITYVEKGEVKIEVRLILRWICEKPGTIREITGLGEIEELESSIGEVIMGGVRKINMILRKGEVSPPIIIKGKVPRRVGEITILPIVYYEIDGEVKDYSLPEKRVKVESDKKHVGEPTACKDVKVFVEFLKEDRTYRLNDKIFIKLMITKPKDMELTLLELSVPFYFESHQFDKTGSRLLFGGYVIGKGKILDSMYLEFTINTDKIRTPIFEDIWNIDLVTKECGQIILGSYSIKITGETVKIK